MNQKQKKKPLAIKRVFIIIIGLVLVLIAGFNIVNLIWGTSIINLITGEKDEFISINIPNQIIETAAPQATPHPKLIPEKIVIPVIDLDAPVKIAYKEYIEIDEETFVQFAVPEEFAAGWHEDSAGLGEIGNIVISGHHNSFGEVFGKLDQLEAGDLIQLSNQGKYFDYLVIDRLILPEKDESIEKRIENARWILPSDDERLTLVTCWPHWSNTHRLIIVAIRSLTPVDFHDLSNFLTQTGLPTANPPNLPK
jgi:LPXTG-site transpeptidase (sortase) family protein